MEMSPYGTMWVTLEKRACTYSFGGYCAANARTVPTIRMLSILLDDNLLAGIHAAGIDRALCFMQFNDYAHLDLGSIAYGKRQGHESLVDLIPDTYFYFTNGYEATRRTAAANRFPDWAERLPKVFWRGSSTTNWQTPQGEWFHDVRDIPRVKLCEVLRNDARADVGISAPWGPRSQEIASFLSQANLSRPAVPMHEHAKYRYQIDIDGVANAWSFFDKLLMGSCILKVDSPFKQWYYDEIRPWKHYVPVKADFSDIRERLDWAYGNVEAAREIANNAQQFALEHTLQNAVRAAQTAFLRRLIPF